MLKIVSPPINEQTIHFTATTIANEISLLNTAIYQLSTSIHLHKENRFSLDAFNFKPFANCAVKQSYLTIIQSNHNARTLLRQILKLESESQVLTHEAV
jgi:hypothetical protein